MSENDPGNSDPSEFTRDLSESDQAIIFNVLMDEFGGGNDGDSGTSN